MSDNYTQFSEIVPGITDAEKRWIELVLTDWENHDEPGQPIHTHLDAEGDVDLYKYMHEDGYNHFDWSIDKDGLWIRAEESGEPDKVADFMQVFLRKFRPTETFSLTWASTCSRLRVSEFCGGAVLVTADWIKWYTDEGISDLAESYRKAKKNGKKFQLRDLEK